MRDKTKVFYDGNCKICNREINVYKRLDNEKKIEWVNIHGPSLKSNSEGIDKEDLMRVLHLKTEDGQILKGVDAFIKIWSNIRYLKILVLVLKIYPLKKIVNFFYMIWAKNRKIKY